MSSRTFHALFSIDVGVHLPECVESTVALSNWFAVRSGGTTSWDTHVRANLVCGGYRRESLILRESNAEVYASLMINFNPYDINFIMQTCFKIDCARASYKALFIHKGLV